MPPRFRLPFALHPFRPRLIDSLRGYTRNDFFHDLGAGLTVGVVALPLAMAFAIASGVKPEQGIFTAIIAGFVISALGGSSVQIGGPAGAFIVIVYGILLRYGLTNLLISTALAGVVLVAMGALKLGGLVRYMPVSIVIGFTNGIAVLIALSQGRDLLGLHIPRLPSDFFEQIGAFATHIDTFNPYAFALGAACVAGLFVWPRLFAPGSVLPGKALEGITLRTAARMPGPIVALVTLTLLAAVLHLPVETIGSRFGGIPQGLPSFTLPPFSWDSAKQLFIPTLTIALLGAIESLLCARVSDNLIDAPRHDPNQELMAQGIANMICPFFGGLPATGTIARTVTNVRAGARTPIAGIVHALTLLAIVLVAAPLAEYVPLAALAGILLFVAWNMGEWREFARLRHFSMQYRTILVGTFLLTVIFDLTVAVQVGLVLACVFFIHRMSTLFRVEAHEASSDTVRVVRLYGTLFFGAVSKIEAVGEALPAGTRAVVLEAHRLISLDTSGLEALEQLHRNLGRQGVRLLLCELNEQPRSLLHRSGFEASIGAHNVLADLPAAMAAAMAT
jgi:SulP family sulfate permease